MPEGKHARVVVPDMCQKHQRLLVDQVGIGPDGPWRSCIISAQITLFQGATADPKMAERLGGDITRIVEVGCLACHRPDVFGGLVDAWQRGGMGGCKQYGLDLIANANKGAS